MADFNFGGRQYNAQDYVSNLSRSNANARRGALRGRGSLSDADIENQILSSTGLTREQLTPQMQSQLTQLMGMTQQGQTKGFGTALKGFQETAPAALAQLQAEQQQQEVFSPYQERGDMALNQQEALLGLRGADAMNQAYQENPAQAFARQQQEQALLRNSAATGGLRGSGVQRELAELTSGLTNQNIYNQVQQLGGMANRGYNAAQNIAGSYGQEGQIQAGQMVDSNAIANQMAAQRAAENTARSQRNRSMVSSAINLGTGVATGGASLLGGSNVIPQQNTATNY